MPNAIATEKKRSKQETPANSHTHKKASVWLVIILVIVLIIFGFSLAVFFRAEEFGSDAGMAAGSAAGKLAGSYEGITQGLAEGAKEGKEEGLSAKDTEVNIANKVKSIGKLEVLSASVVIHDVTGISDKYRTLLAFYGDITFTVDLYETEIKSDGALYEVTLPLPEPTLRLNESKSEQIASSMKHSWTGSDQDGYIAAMNSIKEVNLNAEESVTNYDQLQDSARQSAEKQITFLIQSATKEEVTVHVSFKDSSTEE